MYQELRMQTIKEPNLAFRPNPNSSCKPNPNSNGKPKPSYFLGRSFSPSPNGSHCQNSNPSSDSKHCLNPCLNSSANANISRDSNDCLNSSRSFDIIPNSSPNHGYIDASVGALVWVRRRNGSWWPGRILGPEELPASHLMSPRAGTPVKLLGREDGSVDWYNIEKSRRVKAFRCGEFDLCIQKALSLASVFSKKREKYARREDAILHALELEKKHLKETQIFGGSMYIEKNYREMSDFMEDNLSLNENIDIRIPKCSFQQNFINPENPTDSGQASLDSIFDSQGNKGFLHPGWDDDDDVVSIPLMRSAQQFGLSFAVSSESKPKWNPYHNYFPHVPGAADVIKVGSSMGGTSMSSLVDSENIPPVFRKKACLDTIKDENGFKKRRLMANFHESSLKFGDYAFDFHSEVPTPDCIVDFRRNENTLEPSVVVDKLSSDFPDIVSFGGQLHEINHPGVISVDSTLKVKSGSSASFFGGAGYSGSSGVTDADIKKTGSFTMNESIAIPPLNVSHREELYDQLANDFGLRGQKSGKKIDLAHEYSLECNMPSEVATNSLYNDKLDENSILLRRSIYDEDNLLFHRTDIGNEHFTPMFKQCLSVVAEEEGERERCLTGEDEADSLQPISGPSLSSPEGVDMRDSSIEISREKCAADSFSSFYDPYNVEEPSEVQGAHDTANAKDDGIADSFDNLSTCDSANIANPYGCKITEENALPKWQTKGMRQERIQRIGWRFVSTRLQTENHFDLVVETNGVALCDPVRKRKSKQYVESKLIFDSKVNVVGSVSCPSHLPYNKNAPTSQAGYRNRSRSSMWIDVRVEVQDAVRQKAAVISVSSKLNGKPILGHPIQVELIQKGCTDSCYTNKHFMHPAWKTARRTAMQRIPRFILSQDCLSQYGMFQSYVSGAQINLKQVRKKSGSHARSSTRKRKKPLKKHTLVPKTGVVVSSMAVQHLDTNMEPDAHRPPIVTCVPVSVVFNRIREVLYRGSSNHALSDSDNLLWK